MDQPIEISRRSVIIGGLASGALFATGACEGTDDTQDDPDPTKRQLGEWRLVDPPLLMVPIHAAMLNTGEVLCWAPDLKQTHEDVRGWHAFPGIGEMNSMKLCLFNPIGDTVRYPPMSPVKNQRNLFCASQTFLPNGELLVAGGHAHPSPFSDHEGADHLGADKDIHVYNPTNYSWDRRDNMLIARWYPTSTALEDGRVLIVGGHSKGVPPTGSATTIYGAPLVNPTYDIFDPITRNVITDGVPREWLSHLHYPWGEQTLYPFVKLLPGGSLFVHNHSSTRFWWPAPESGPLGRRLSPEVYNSSNSIGYRTYPGQGACVLLPLKPDSTHVRVLILGGGDEANVDVNHTTRATDTAEIFDFHTDRPAPTSAAGWRPIAKMHHRRFMSDAVLLPDGNVFVLGGAAVGQADDNSEPVRETEMFDSVAETWTPMPAHSVERRYHSIAVCLPSGRVFSAGSTGSWPHPPWPLDDRHPGTYPEYRVEIYSPGYLYRGTRPVVLNPPSDVFYGQVTAIELSAETPEASRATLLRPCAVTHTNDMEQRHVELEVVDRRAGLITARMPPDGTWAPPGWYMLFVLTADGVPSRGHFVHLS